MVCRWKKLQRDAVAQIENDLLATEVYLNQNWDKVVSSCNPVEILTPDDKSDSAFRPARERRLPRIGIYVYHVASKSYA